MIVEEFKMLFPSVSCSSVSSTNVTIGKLIEKEEKNEAQERKIRESKTVYKDQVLASGVHPLVNKIHLFDISSEMFESSVLQFLDWKMCLVWMCVCKTTYHSMKNPLNWPKKLNMVKTFSLYMQNIMLWEKVISMKIPIEHLVYQQEYSKHHLLLQINPPSLINIQTEYDPGRPTPRMSLARMADINKHAGTLQKLSLVNYILESCTFQLNLLSRCNHLTELNLDKCSLSNDRWTSFLQSLVTNRTPICALSLNATDICDSHVSIICQLPMLHTLALGSTLVTDKCLDNLYEKKLQKLSLYNTNILHTYFKNRWSSEIDKNKNIAWNLKIIMQDANPNTNINKLFKIRAYDDATSMPIIYCDFDIGQ